MQAGNLRITWRPVMIEPEIAPVTPRVIWPETGDAVPIDEIFRRMEGKPTGAIEIIGESGRARRPPCGTLQQRHRRVYGSCG